MTKKSREEKLEALVTGSDGHVRGAAIQVKTKAGRLINGSIYTGDGSSVQTDHQSRRIIRLV